MRFHALFVLSALLCTLLMLAFVVITDTGAPGVYGAGFVAVALNMMLHAWVDRHRARGQR